MWQYNFTGASNVYILIIQSETPYWQLPPSAWSTVINDCTGVHVYGAGACRVHVTAQAHHHIAGMYNWFGSIQEVRMAIVDLHVHHPCRSPSSMCLAPPGRCSTSSCTEVGQTVD